VIATARTTENHSLWIGRADIVLSQD